MKYVAFIAFRYPVILDQFSLRLGSGGAGKYCGGDGVVRKLLFRSNVVLSVLTERRSTRPYGLKGNVSGRSLWSQFLANILVRYILIR